MLRGRRAGIAAALAIAATAAVTAGCGGGSTRSALQLDPVAAAATKTQDAGAARIRFAIAVSGPRMPANGLRIHGTGAIDGSRAEMSLKLGSMLGPAGIPPAALQKLEHSSLKEVALEQGGDYVVYMRLGFLASQLPGGRQWIKLDLSKLGKSAGLDLGNLLGGSEFQPTDLLGMLEVEGGNVHKVGPAIVGGTATTHYRVAIDLAKALRSKGVTGPMFKRMASQMTTVHADVWIGENGLVRRIRTTYGMAEDGKHVGLAMTMDLFDYGAHVTIAAPPSSEVFDATQLAQSGLGSLH